MKKIYSKIEPEILLHTVFRFEDIIGDRIDISPNEEFLQISAFKLPLNKTFRPHKHIPFERITTITQEAWIVVGVGAVKVLYYDIDDSVIEEIILNVGDLTITYRGGHNYLALTDSVAVYEIKTGPYNGQAADKVFID